MIQKISVTAEQFANAARQLTQGEVMEERKSFTSEDVNEFYSGIDVLRTNNAINERPATETIDACSEKFSALLLQTSQQMEHISALESENEELKRLHQERDVFGLRRNHEIFQLTAEVERLKSQLSAQSEKCPDCNKEKK